jgi:hypothetical protein
MENALFEPASYPIPGRHVLNISYIKVTKTISVD